MQASIIKLELRVYTTRYTELNTKIHIEGSTSQVTLRSILTSLTHYTKPTIYTTLTIT